MSEPAATSPRMNARVLLIDDSAAMRALFSDLLEETDGVQVIATAASAEQAREMLAEVKPNVITLDIDMPGMNGIEFLEELMAKKPIPVVILSSLSQKGSKIAKQALQLGAISCFAKPLKVNSGEFAKAVSKLGEAVIEAANTDIHAHLAAIREKAAGS